MLSNNIAGNPCIDFCLKCKYFRRNVKKPSHRCSICMDSYYNAHVVMKHQNLEPLFYEYKRKKDNYGQLYFHFV